MKRRVHAQSAAYTNGRLSGVTGNGQKVSNSSETALQQLRVEEEVSREHFPMHSARQETAAGGQVHEGASCAAGRESETTAAACQATDATELRALMFMRSD